MYIPRNIDSALIEWKDDPFRKPMLLRGARQTGKTTAVRNFAKQFDSFVELNFEKDNRLFNAFENDFNIRRIVGQIEGILRKKITPGKTLVFLDEIQLCPRAISALRYFYEDMPELHVIATGSLLEFVFTKIKDFGVGRIRNAFIYPFSFTEFAQAVGDEILIEHMRKATFSNPLSEIDHSMLLELLKTYIIVGGMPAAVNAYAQTHSFLDVQRMHKDIMTSLKDDFGKYDEKVPAERIRNALSSIIAQTGGKFIYTNSDLQLSYKQAKESADLLELSKLVVRIMSCHANGIPLGGDINPKSNKFILLDTGLYLHECGLDLSDLIAKSPSDFINSGKLAEMLVGLELAKSADAFTDTSLFYWHREAANSTAEVDYLMQHNGAVLPIEVKAGTQGAMKSLHMLMKEKSIGLGIRTSQENLGTIGSIRIIPHYMIGEWKRLLSAVR
jgi:predicted AAA+ superfamily ATPase